MMPPCIGGSSGKTGLVYTESIASIAANIPWSVGTLDGRSPVTVMTPSRSKSDTDGLRPTNEKRLQRSPCSTDSSKEAGLVADKFGERRHGCFQVAEHLGPHGHDAVFRRMGAELFA